LVARFNGLAYSAHLDCGDLLFWSGGDEPGTHAVVVEVKKPGDDLVDSVVHSGRLVEQLRTARGLFPQCVYVLVIEGGKFSGPDEDGDWATRTGGGRWRKAAVPGSKPPRAVAYRRVINFLNTLRFVEGVQVVDTGSERETVEYVLSLYHWWQRNLGDHTSTTGNRLYQPVWLGPGGEVPLIDQWAIVCPGLGTKRRRAVRDRFPSAWAFANATVEELATVEGVGKVTAGRVWRAIRQNGTGGQG
jgi:ERCC4-type nuclease